VESFSGSQEAPGAKNDIRRMLSDPTNAGDYENQIIIFLLLSLLVVVVLLGLVLTAMVLHWRLRQGAWSSIRLFRATAAMPWESTAPASRSAQARPATWLAVRTTHLKAVQRALALNDLRPCAWTESLTSETSRRLYVSPPVAGWILVAGAELPDPAEDIDACYRFLAGLSRQLGHVQYFHRNRVTHHHAWARLESGRVLRAYAWIGHTAWNQGRPSAAERELGLSLFDYAESLSGDEEALPLGASENVERLPQLAARWSIDPAGVAARFWSAHPGISGDYSVPRLL
jgi:hypothetical protein